MEIFVAKLLESYKQKLRILRDLKHFIGTRLRPGPIEEIIRQPALAYTDEERRVISRLTGTLDELEQVNNKLKAVEIMQVTSDINIINSYREMRELVDEEHEILAEFLNPAIKGILERRDVSQWIEHLEHMENFIDVLKEDLKLFNILLKELVKRGHLGELRERSVQIAGERRQRQLAFFNDLFRELRNERVLAYKVYSDSSVERLIKFAHDNRILNEDQAKACALLSILIIRRDSGDLDEAERALSRERIVRCFEPLKPHFDVIKGFRTIIEELRQQALYQRVQDWFNAFCNILLDAQKGDERFFEARASLQEAVRSQFIDEQQKNFLFDFSMRLERKAFDTVLEILTSDRDKHRRSVFDDFAITKLIEVTRILKERASPIQPSPPTTEQELISLWVGCASIDIFKTRFEPLGFSVSVLVNVMGRDKDQLDNLWIASKDDTHYLFPAYHGSPLKMSGFFTRFSSYYEYDSNGAKIITGIKKLAKIYPLIREQYRQKTWISKDREKGILELSYPELSDQDMKLLAAVNSWLALPPKLRKNYKLQQMCMQLGLSIELCALSLVNFGSGASPMDLHTIKRIKQLGQRDSINLLLCKIDGTENEFFAIPFRDSAILNLIGGSQVMRINIYAGFDRLPQNAQFEKIYRSARIELVPRQAPGEKHDIAEAIVMGYLKFAREEIPSQYLPPPSEPPTFEQIVGSRGPIAEEVPEYRELADALNRGLARTEGYGTLIDSEGRDYTLRPMRRSVDSEGIIQIGSGFTISQQYISEIRDNNSKLLWKKSTGLHE